MQGWLLPIALLFSFFSSSAWASQERCISHDNLQKIASSFSQLQQYVGNRPEYCPGDFDDQWFKIANSLNVLLTINPNEPAPDISDALTYQAITEKDWWAYFTNRAKTFQIESNCPQNVVAYVMPFWGNGQIHLCQLFFDQSVSSQASTMMHEVRHFDGHRHVTCSQGNEKGVSGACDETITGRGSYAISVQTLVGMARSNDISQAEKPILEAEAVYMAFNKFNVVPKVKLNNSIILSNSQSEVFSWKVDGDITKIGDLDEPSVVINSANNLTIYPLNPESNAYRKDNKLLGLMDNPGLYAKHYNTETPEERAHYRSISYFPTGGLLKDNTLLTLCNSQTTDLYPTDLSFMGNVSRMISMSTDATDQNRETLLMTEQGELYYFECESANSDKLFFSKRSETIDPSLVSQIVDSFGLGGEQYALLDSGELALLNMESEVLNLDTLTLPVVNQNWVSASPISIPEVF